MGKSPQVNREVWLKDIEDLIANLEMLFEYSEVNIVAFKKIIKKFQKYIEHGNVSNVWTVIKAYRFFSNSELDQVLLAKAKKELRKSVPEMALTPTEALPVADQGNVPTVTKLDLDALPGGQISKLWLAVYEDGTGSLIRIPVIVAKGVKYGPTVGMTAALHGNELNGIPLIHRLFREINPQQLHGVLVAATVTNVPGYVRNQRGFSDGTDLNRIMPGKANGSSPQVYAYNLMERLIKKFDYLLDIHTASAGRVNSLYARADMINPKTKKMAILQNPQIIVHNTSPDGSLRGAAMSNDIPAITVEIGDPSKFQKRFVKNALLGVTNILCHLNMIPNEVDQPEYDPVVCSRSYWIFASKGGVLTVQPEIYTWVRKGEMIAQLHSLFGDLVETYYAPEDGVVVGKSVNPVCESGSRIIHLGVVEDSFAKEAHDGHL
ncbi:uncharacterized protein BJ171DRAFT_226562 [Polychytrium aggregatum]|uniref:uncharacterized protein n=1 Tax=Polychytrium aggregatum TaxID=110093 RepID=UPI0022FF2AC5|nr:uncharacterized protein BJ171DRAFT_226562 [Polychytrium aggregatum]KAI9197311.1 hypothetical protein BJ171DRAFT_226562 [Polychytrium aggregatum]